MNWYVYDEEGSNVAVVNATDLIEAQKEAEYIGYGGQSIERA